MVNPKAGPGDYIERIIPADIGEDYLKHHEALGTGQHDEKAKKNQQEVEKAFGKWR